MTLEQILSVPTAPSRHDGRRIFVGVQEMVPPKDTSLVPFETPGLDIWTWNANEIPPAQKVNLTREAARTYPAEVLPGGSLKLLNQDKFTRFSQGNRGDSPYNLKVKTLDPVEMQWNYQPTVQVILEGPDGEKELVTGNVSGVNLSPLAQHVIWWDYSTLTWNLYDIASAHWWRRNRPQWFPGKLPAPPAEEPMLRRCGLSPACSGKTRRRLP